MGTMNEGRYAIFGAGAIGCFFGALLLRSGREVSVIARGRHLEAIASDGIDVEGLSGDFHVTPAAVTDRPADVGPVDAVIVAVKAWQVPEAAAQLRPMIAPGTRVLPLQNGVEAPSQLADALGAGAPLVGLCRVGVALTAPGRVRHAAIAPVVALGEPGGGALSDRARALAAALAGAGVNVETPADIQSALWEKLLFIAALSGVGAVTRAPAGEIRSCTPSRELMRRVMEEVQAVARGRGVAMPAEVVERTMSFVDSMPPGSTASMHRDIVEGRPSELEAILGALVRQGRGAGVPTPAAEFLYASLLPQETRARGAASA